MSGETGTEVLLLAIDLQPVFLRSMVEGEQVQRRCAFTLAAAHGLGIPALFTEQVPHKLGGTVPDLLALSPKALVHAKGTFSAFACPEIRAAVTRSGATHLLLCGLETPVCIYQTALDALADGLQVTVLSDAIGARRPEDARICLEALIRAGAHVLPAETVFYALLQSVQHPYFKAFTQLVKTHG